MKTNIKLSKNEINNYKTKISKSLFELPKKNRYSA